MIPYFAIGRLLRENFWPKFGHPVTELPGGSQNFCAIESEIGRIFASQFGHESARFCPPTHPDNCRKSANYCHQLGDGVRLFLTIMG